MVVLGFAALVLALAAIAQAVRIGLTSGDWIAVKLTTGVVIVSAMLLLVVPHVSLGN